MASSGSVALQTAAVNHPQPGGVGLHIFDEQWRIIFQSVPVHYGRIFSGLEPGPGRLPWKQTAGPKKYHSSAPHGGFGKTFGLNQLD
jgi:hypothetical protein